MADGFIKLHRSMLEWEWYRNINTKSLFIHMLFKANYKEGKFEGKTIPIGSFVSSTKKLSDETGLTNDEVRTALKHLISTKEITKQSYSKYTVFTIKNYIEYQIVPEQNPKQFPSNSQSIPNLFPTIEEEKEGKNEKNNKNTMCKTDVLTLFETLWKIYPNKKGKGQISDAKKQRIAEIGLDEMKRTIERYLKDLEKDKEWRKPQNGSTFFNSGYVDYLDANYEGEEDANEYNGFSVKLW